MVVNKLAFCLCPHVTPAYKLNLSTFSNLFLCLFSHSPTRGSTIKISRINVPTATVPTLTLRRCRSTCQHMPSKTLRPTAAACAAGHTPQWVKPQVYLAVSQRVFRKVVYDLLLIRWWHLMFCLPSTRRGHASCSWYLSVQRVFAVCSNLSTKGRLPRTILLVLPMSLPVFKKKKG